MANERYIIPNATRVLIDFSEDGKIFAIFIEKEDKSCQLCKETVGTLEHRFHCRATTPEEGWPLPPKKAKLAVETLASNRLRILKTRGLLVLRVPVQRPSQEGNFV